MNITDIFKVMYCHGT